MTRRAGFAALAIILGLSLASVGTFAGSAYVPPVTASSVSGLGTAATLDVGTGASQVVQLTAASKLPAVDGSLLTNVSGGGAYDWAATSSTIVPANWQDAGGAFGGATDHCVETLDSVLVRGDNALDADCTTPLSGNRSTGILTAVGAGDFTSYIRAGFRRSVAMDAAASYVLGGVVFVDGADATAAWYSNMLYWYSTDFAISQYCYSDTSTGAGNWDSAGSGIALGITYAPMATWDFVIKRVGTAVSFYMGQPGGRLTLAHTYTGASAGAGFVGIKTQTISGTADDISGVLYAYRTSMTVVP